jgi:hypothetical protein
LELERDPAAAWIAVEKARVSRYMHFCYRLLYSFIFCFILVFSLD